MRACPVLAILLFASYVWGMPPTTAIVFSPKLPSLVSTYSMSRLFPSIVELHSHPAGALVQASEALLLQTAHQSVFLPKAPVSGLLIMTQAQPPVIALLWLL